MTELKPLEDRNRHIIESGTEVLGGKLLTRAAFVVDAEENPEIYGRILELIDERMAGLERMGAQVGSYDRLKATFAAVSRVLPWNEPQYAATLKAEALSRGVERVTTDHEIGLSRFIGVAGMCHQHSLLSATMLRLMQERGDLGGNVSVETAASRGSGVSADHPRRHTRAILIEEGVRYSLDTDTGLTIRRHPVNPVDTAAPTI